MARTETDLLRLLTQISAAGLGEQSWKEALAATSAFFGAVGGAVFDLDRGAGSVSGLHTFGLGETSGDYARRMNAINPRMHRALAQRGRHTASDYSGLTEAAIGRHEFYDWLKRECGVKYFVGSRMMDAGNISSFVSIEFTARHGHAEPKEVELFDLVGQHVANAWRLSRSFARLSEVEGMHEALAETVRWGVIGFDRSGHVRTMNRRARAVLARADGLVIRDDRLRALRAATDRTLGLLIAQTLRTAADAQFFPGGALAIPRRGGGPPYVVRIMPTRCGAEQGPDLVVMLAFLSDPDVGVPSRDELRAIFGLTDREAELSVLIAGGWSLKAAAGRIGIAHNTARVHLGNVMTKTGTHSQVALVALLRSLPGAADA